VSSFGQQRDGVSPEAADPLDDREAAQHCERDPQALLTRVFAPVMMMVMAVIMIVAAAARAPGAATVVVTIMIMMASVVVVRRMPGVLSRWVIVRAG